MDSSPPLHDTPSSAKSLYERALSFGDISIPQIDILLDFCTTLLHQDPLAVIDIARTLFEFSKKHAYTKGEASSLLFLGKAQYQLGEFMESVYSLTESLEREVGDAYWLRCEAFLWLGVNYHRLSQFDAAERQFTKALELAESLKLERAYAFGLAGMGYVKKSRAEFQTALSYFTESISISTHLGDQVAEAYARVGIGRIQYKQGFLSAALASFISSLKTFEILEHREAIANLFVFIGEVFELQHEMEHALNYYDRSRSIYEQIGNSHGVGSTLVSTGTVLFELKRYSEAKSCFERSLGLFRRQFDKKGEAQALYYLALTDHALGQSDTAIALLRQALSLYELLLSKEEIIETLLSLARVSLENDLSQAIFDAERYLRKANALAESIDLKPLQIRIATLSYQVYKLKGDAGQALSYLEKSISLQKEIASLDEKTSLSQVITEYETTRVRQEAEVYKLKNLDLFKSYQELIAINSELMEQDAMRNAILSVAIHDIKNPLQIVKGYNELLLERIHDQGPRDMLMKMNHATTQVITLIGALLEINRSDGAQQRKAMLSVRSFNFSYIVYSVLELNRVQLEKKNQTLHLSVDDTKDYIIDADEAKCREIVENLITNAIKYSENGAEIWVTLSRSHSTLYFSVRDEGQGFSQEEAKELFKKFKRLSAKPTGGEISTGLGLSIVKEYVTLHGGVITGTSPGIGQGSTFSIELPTTPESRSPNLS